MRTVKTLIRPVDAQADLSLRWVHMPFYWFCHEAAQLYGTAEIATWGVSSVALTVQTKQTEIIIWRRF